MYRRSGMLLLVMGAASVAGAQCGLDARNSRNVPLPVLEKGAMQPALESRIRRGFDLLYVTLQVAQAERVLQGAYGQAESGNDRCGQALAMFGLGQAARETHMADSLPRFRKAAELLQGIGTPLAMAYVHERVAMMEMHANVVRGLGNLPKSAAEFHAAGDEANSIASRTINYSLAGDKPPLVYQKGLFEELKSVQAPNAVMVRGMVQFMWGRAFDSEGRFAEATDHFHAGLAFFRQCQCGEEIAGSINVELASASTDGSDAAATLGYALEADRIFVKAHLLAKRPQSLHAVLWGYRQAGDMGRAIQAGEASLKVGHEQQELVYLPEIASDLAATFGEAKRPLDGLALLKKEASLPSEPVDKCRFLMTRGALETQAQLSKQAEVDLQEWQTSCKTVFAPLPDVDGELAQALTQQGRLNEALVHADTALEIIDKQRSQIDTTDRNLIGFNDAYVMEYQTKVKVLSLLHRDEDALLVSEQYRSRPFLDLVNSPRRGLEQARAPRIANTAEAKLSVPTLRGGDAGNAGEQATLRSEIHPFTLTSADIHRSVDQTHATLVSYWVDDDTLHVWVLKPGEPLVSVSRTIDPVKMAALVRVTQPGWAPGSRGARVRTRGGKTQAVAATDRQAWRDLYTMLIAPIEEHLPQKPGSLLTIVPQGVLFQLSFPALMDSKGRYLIERYSINTVPAAGVLQVTERNEAGVGSGAASYLLVANPERFPSVGGRPLPALPGTITEVRGISRALQGRSVTVLEGRQAGIDTMTDSLSKATVLHLATHAVVSDDAPMTSFLALDRNQQKGMLTAASVYGLTMHASLVVLSACGTGRGKISGDGVAGLSRAFFYAGAASLVTTLWDVVDEPTAELMPKFYAELAKGKSRSEALREAQLGLIDDLRHHRVRVQTLAGTSVSLPESPAYWAAFSLSGQP